MVGRRISFTNFLFSEIQRVGQIPSRILIGHKIQSFEATYKSFWIWAPYKCIIDCVKKHQALRSEFSPPPRISQRSQTPGLIGLSSLPSYHLCLFILTILTMCHAISYFICHICSLAFQNYHLTKPEFPIPDQYLSENTSGSKLYMGVGTVLYKLITILVSVYLGLTEHFYEQVCSKIVQQ